MVLTADDRVLIKALRVEKGFGARKIVKEFPTRKWNVRAVSRLLKRIDSTGSADRLQGGGRPRSSRTQPNVAIVDDLILRQEGQPGTHRTVRQIARETGISKFSVNRIAHTDLSLKCFKKKQAQDLTEANRLARFTRARQLLRKYPSSLTSFIWFTDEKLFTVTSPVNLQNDRLYAPAGTKKKELPAERCLRVRSNFSQSVMVSVAVSALGCTDLVFIEPGVKINGAYYRDVLLSQYLLPAIRELSGNDFFIFQQDSAPAHRARETVELLTREAPDFISPLLWPPNSPDLNPVDYKIWGVLQERVYKTRIRDAAHLRERLLEEWSKFDQRIIDGAVQQWRHRLQECVRAEGGHFEYRL
jgi:inhibitor of nuclear factor kappa-B kinase subunit alpha